MGDSDKRERTDARQISRRTQGFVKDIVKAMRKLELRSKSLMEDGVDGKLCTRCAIDILPQLKSGPPTSESEPLCYFSRTSLIDECPSCQFFTTLTPKGQRMDQGNSYLSRLYLRPVFALWSSGGFPPEGFELTNDPSIDSSWFKIEHKMFHEENGLVSEYGASLVPIFFGFADSFEVDVRRRPHHALLLEPDRINFTLMKDCLHFCGEYHPPPCKNTDCGLPSSFSVIDCEQRIVTALPLNAEFVALSYVWGNPQAEPQPHATGSNLLTGLPLVIEDSISVTLSLGLRYLWVDRYCISKDATIKHNQIQQMDLVYRSAYVTIIAACGQDTSFGLPGVSTRQRHMQPHLKLSSGTLAASPRQTMGSVTNSRWATRGWTFQECLLSRRRLYFTRYEVVFECAVTNFRESVSQPLHVTYDARNGVTKRFDRLIPIYPSAFDLLFYENPVKQVWTWIGLYTRRSLTYESDALNGMLGLFRTLKDHPDPVFQCWGIPFQHVEDSCSIRSPLNALCWSNIRGPKKRREGFPSWSWAGWLGRTNNFNWNQGEIIDDNLIIGIERSDGEELDGWPDHTNVELSQFLLIEGLSVKVHPSYIDRAYGRQFDKMEVCDGVLGRSDPIVENLLHSNFPDVDHSEGADTEQKEYVGVVMCTIPCRPELGEPEDDRYPVAAILVLQLKQEWNRNQRLGAERVEYIAIVNSVLLDCEKTVRKFRVG